MNEPTGTPRASYGVAYVLCLLLGWLGAHRYYLRRWRTAFAYTVTVGLLVTIVLKGWEEEFIAIGIGLLGLAVLVDLLILPLLVRERRDIEAGIPLPPDAAPWAEGEVKSWPNRIQLWLRYAIVVVLPSVTVVVATSLGQTVVVVLVFVLLAFSLLVGSIGRGLYALEDMAAITQKVPILPAAIDVVTRFQRHYLEHQTHSVFFYLLYPVLGPLFMIFSPAARSEFRPFLSLFSLVVFGVLFESVVTYFKVFPLEYFNFEFGITISLIMALGGIALFFVCVVPIVSSSFYLSMTGRSVSLRTSAALALVGCGFAVYAAGTVTSVPLRGSLTAMEKVNSAVFRNRFDRMNIMFLESEMDKALGMVRENVMWEIEPQEDVVVASDPFLMDVSLLSVNEWSYKTSSDWYRVFMSGMLRDEEAAAFRVLSIVPSVNMERTEPWLAIQFTPDPVGIGGAIGESVLLYVISPGNPDRNEAPRVRERWRDLPDWFTQQFEIVDRAALRTAPNQLTKATLRNDLLFHSDENGEVDSNQERRIPSPRLMAKCQSAATTTSTVAS